MLPSLLARSFRIRHLVYRTLIVSKRASFQPQNKLLPQYLLPSLARHADRTAVVSGLCKYAGPPTGFNKGPGSALHV